MDGKITPPANGLKLINLKSRVIPIYPDFPKRNGIKPNELLPLITKNFVSNAYVIAYLYSYVMVGKWENNSLLFHDPQQFDESKILKLRVFNREQELLVWKSGNELKARLRKDDPKGANCFVVVADHVLSGTQSKISEKGWTRIWENRGGILYLPLLNTHVDSQTNPQKRIHIRTNNYIDENEAYQSTYVDCRFLGFTYGEGNNFIS